MKNTSTQSLAESMKAGLEDRPAGRLRAMAGQERPTPFAVPLEQDTYEIALDHIEPDPGQPRKIFDTEELEHLAASMRKNGLLQPIIVYRTGDTARYRIIAGERRYRAAVLAGLTAIPCIEMAPGFDRSLIDQLQLVENIQRADLHPLDAAEAIENYIERHRLTQREAADRLGKPLAFVAELLAIRRIPPELLTRKGVSRLPKQTLVEIGRAPLDQQSHLLDRALTGTSLDEIKSRRLNRSPRTRVVFFRERFLLERQPPIEINWRRPPEEVSDEELVEALAAVARIIIARRSELRSNFEHRQ